MLLEHLLRAGKCHLSIMMTRSLPQMPALTTFARLMTVIAVIIMKEVQFVCYMIEWIFFLNALEVHRLPEGTPQF